MLGLHASTPFLKGLPKTHLEATPVLCEQGRAIVGRGCAAEIFFRENLAPIDEKLVVLFGRHTVTVPFEEAGVVSSVITMVRVHLRSSVWTSLVRDVLFHFVAFGS
jgi:hypothetical protein